MNVKNLRTIAMFCLIGGVVLCAFAQILPWGEIDMSPSASVIFYSWGLHASSTETNEIGSYFNFVAEINKTKYFGPGEYSTFLIPILISISILPFSILIIVFSIMDYLGMKKGQVRIGIYSGIISIVVLVLFYIFIQFGVISSNARLSSLFQYTSGFYLMIIAVVLFISAHLITGIGVESK